MTKILLTNAYGLDSCRSTTSESVAADQADLFAVPAGLPAAVPLPSMIRRELPVNAIAITSHKQIFPLPIVISPRSDYYYFDTGFTTDPAIFRIEISTERVQRLIELKDFPGAAWEPFGCWSGLSPDSSVITQRDTSTQEIYAFDLQLP